MNKIITFLTVLLTCLTATAQNITGSWNGALDLGSMQLNLVFNITDKGNGEYGCTLDSPDQGAKGIPADITVTDKTKVKISISALKMVYEGELKEGMLKGQFMQNGFTAALDMKPGTVKQNRPQTPQPPYPYTTEEVTFTNSDDNVTLSGTLTYPTDFDKKKKGTVPVVIMVTGSGQQNRDEELLGHKPFLVIADYLARNGIATLRYDDRGMGKSTGNAAEGTTENNMKDALAAIDYARKTGKFGRTGVLGHSEGGTIAFMLGARGKADFIISMAGPGVSGDSILIEQNRIALAMSGLPQYMIEPYCTALASVFEAIKDGTATKAPEGTVKKAIEKAGGTIPQQLQANLSEVIKTATPWLRYFIAYDPTDDIKAVKCPVLALNGEKDTQVTPKTNMGAIRRLLPDNPDNTIKTYPNLNHLFQTCTTGFSLEYGKIEETIAPEVLKDIADWVNKIGAKKR